MKKHKSGTKRFLWIAASVLLAVCAYGISGAGSDAARVVTDGKSDCVIVVPDGAGGTERYAAEELQRHLEMMSGARLEVLEEKDAAGRAALLAGATRRGAGIVPDAVLKPLGAEGYVLRARGGDVAIRGGSPRGTLYGVYGLLEDHLGVRWYALDATFAPKRKNIVFNALNDARKPAFEYRESFFHDAFDGDWAARNRLNGNHYRMAPKHGGQIKYLGGFVHTLFSLVPPETYFKEHPEYYALIGGRRVNDSQLCLTNPDVLKIVTARVEELAAAANGQPVIISVSQNDNIRPCACERCRAADAEEGSPAGTLIRFVNAVADAVAEKYPNVAIDTLAYQYTENAPRLTRPRPNVIVRLCHMAPSCDFHPLGQCYMNMNYVKNLKAWSHISNRLYVWHYVTDFAHYTMPFPDLNAIIKDVVFYRDHHVKGFFAQGSYQSPGGDMAELKAWLLAKLMWNPDIAPEALIDDFVRGYYGPAAPAMAEYITAQRERARSRRTHANLYSDPGAGYLNEKLLAQMGAALDRAEELAAADPAALDHVRRARLAYTYTRLAAPELFVPKGYRFGPRDQRKLLALLNQFIKDLEHFKVTRLREGDSLDTSLQKLRNRILGWKE